MSGYENEGGVVRLKKSGTEQFNYSSLPSRSPPPPRLPLINTTNKPTRKGQETKKWK
jgi:hypothetical protein